MSAIRVAWVDGVPMEYVCAVDELGGVHGEYDCDECSYSDGERGCGDVDRVWAGGCGSECGASRAAGCWGEGTGGCWGGDWGCGFGRSCGGVVRGERMEALRSFGKANSLVVEFVDDRIPSFDTSSYM